jgi:hypothetical protein
MIVKLIKGRHLKRGVNANEYAVIAKLPKIYATESCSYKLIIIYKVVMKSEIMSQLFQK